MKHLFLAVTMACQIPTTASALDDKDQTAAQPKPVAGRSLPAFPAYDEVNLRADEPLKEDRDVPESDAKTPSEDPEPSAADAVEQPSEKWKPNLRVTLNLTPEGQPLVIKREFRAVPAGSANSWSPQRKHKSDQPATGDEPKSRTFHSTGKAKPRPVLNVGISETATILCDDISMLIAGSEDGQPVYQIKIEHPAVLFIDGLRADFDSLESDNEFATLTNATIQHNSNSFTAAEMKLNLKVYGAATRNFNKPVSEYAEAANPAAPVPMNPLTPFGSASIDRAASPADQPFKRRDLGRPMSPAVRKSDSSPPSPFGSDNLER